MIVGSISVAVLEVAGVVVLAVVGAVVFAVVGVVVGTVVPPVPVPVWVIPLDTGTEAVSEVFLVGSRRVPRADVSDDSRLGGEEAVAFVVGFVVGFVVVPVVEPVWGKTTMSESLLAADVPAPELFRAGVLAGGGTIIVLVAIITVVTLSSVVLFELDEVRLTDVLVCASVRLTWLAGEVLEKISDVVCLLVVPGTLESLDPLKLCDLCELLELPEELEKLDEVESRTVGAMVGGGGGVWGLFCVLVALTKTRLTCRGK